MKWPLLALGATLLLAGCGGDVDPGHTPAGLAQVRFVDNLYNGRLGPVYDVAPSRLPAPRAAQAFVACTRAAALGGLDSIEVLDVYNDPVDIPGSGRVPAKAVRVRLTSSDGEATTFVNHEVKVVRGGAGS